MAAKRIDRAERRSVRAAMNAAALGAVVAATFSAAGLTGALTAASAHAAPCPDVEVVFARGSGEAPGVGGVGGSFADAVRAQAGGRSVDVYAVDYPATNDFTDRTALVDSVIGGIRDEVQHVEGTVANCPNTRIVLGGYSQGAVVTGFSTADGPPAGVPADIVPKPMPADVAGHVAAVVLFGLPSPQFLGTFGAPAVTVGSRYAPATRELCEPGDSVCDGEPGGAPTAAHVLYGVNGLTGEGAAFAVGRL